MPRIEHCHPAPTDLKSDKIFLKPENPNRFSHDAGPTRVVPSYRGKPLDLQRYGPKPETLQVDGRAGEI